MVLDGPVDGAGWYCMVLWMVLDGTDVGLLLFTFAWVVFGGSGSGLSCWLWLVDVAVAVAAACCRSCASACGCSRACVVCVFVVVGVPFFCL
jgi:hypothetical protein